MGNKYILSWEGNTDVEPTICIYRVSRTDEYELMETAHTPERLGARAFAAGVMDITSREDTLVTTIPATDFSTRRRGGSLRSPASREDMISFISGWKAARDVYNREHPEKAAV